MATEPLAKALSTDFSSPIAKQYMASQKPIFEQKQQLSTELGDVERKIAEGKQRQKEIEAEGKVAAGEQFVQQRGEAQQRMQEGLAAAPIEPFVPTKDTAQDIAGLFGLIGVIGMVAGKGNAMQAMGAMNGMLEGHRKGRADLYKQELSTYEKNFKALIKKHDELRTEFKNAVDTYAVDKELGEQKAMLAAAKSESPILQELVRKGEIVRANTLLDDVGKSIGKATELDQKERESIRREAAADRRAKEAREAADKRAQANREAADARAKLKADTKVTKKSSAKIDEGYIADNILKSDIDDLTNDLKTNPSLVNKLKQYRVEAFLTEESKILNQVVNEDIPPDLRQFLTKVRDIRNNYYLNISGKAVTGGEALRNYGTVPQPGDSPENMIDKLQGMSNRVGQSISIKQQFFGLPELKLSAGARTGLTPNENYGVSSQSKFEIGKTYTDQQGNKATYRGVDESGQDVWEEE